MRGRRDRKVKERKGGEFIGLYKSTKGCARKINQNEREKDRKVKERKCGEFIGLQIN